MRAAVHLAAALALGALAFAAAAGPYRTVGDLARVAAFGPSRVRGLGGRLKV